MRDYAVVVASMSYLH